MLFGKVEYARCLHRAKQTVLCGELSIPDNFYFSTVTGQNPRGLPILCAEKVSTESLSLDSLIFANTGDF